MLGRSSGRSSGRSTSALSASYPRRSNAAESTGLRSCALKPAARQRASCSGPLSPLIAMILACSNVGDPRRRRQISYPSIPGSTMSRNTVSGRSCSASGRASAPLAANRTACPAQVRSMPRASRLSGSSSTMRASRGLSRRPALIAACCFHRAEPASKSFVAVLMLACCSRHARLCSRRHRNRLRENSHIDKRSSSRGLLRSTAGCVSGPHFWNLLGARKSDFTARTSANKRGHCHGWRSR
jgi:hypothetical protein